MYTLEKLKKRWSDRRELNKIGKVFKMWYGITTNIMCAPYLQNRDYIFCLTQR